MFSKTLFVIAFAAIAQMVLAAPPACLLGAVNTYEDPADIASVCKARDAATKIQKYCGDSTSDALSAFADICGEAGVEVSTKVPASATATATGSAGTISPSAGSNGTTLATTIATATGGSVPTATGSGAPESTGAAAHYEISAAAMLAGLGVMAGLL